jgi:glycosyltransferase involved in cell wall biosynthesis
MGAMDVNLAASRGEGFGVPVIEAAACGVPSVVSNFTAQPELVEGFGYIAAVQPYWDAPQSSWFATPLVHSVLEELEHAYDTAQDADRKAAARAHAETYDNKIVFDKYWLPVLAEIDELMAK